MLARFGITAVAIAIQLSSGCSQSTPPADHTPAATSTPRAERVPAATSSPSTPPSPASAQPAAMEEDMVLIPAGEFLMGSREGDPLVYPWEAPHEQPQHPVNLKAYYIDRTEVTNAAYERLRMDHKRDERSPCDDCPVTRVTWHAAKWYCENLKPPKRLPTEAEWEKAAKGGATDGGNPEPLEEYGWYSKETITRTQPVGQKKPNGYGVHDMLGNVREWTADWYDPNYYQQRVRDDPKGPAEGVRRVERGGAFFLPRKGVTTTIRYNHPPHFQLYFLGFRCARDG